MSREPKEFTLPLVQELESPAVSEGWVIRSPPAANWQFHIGDDSNGLSFNLYMKRGPNRFHRFMQRWLLGIHWRRIG